MYIVEDNIAIEDTNSEMINIKINTTQVFDILKIITPEEISKWLGSCLVSNIMAIGVVILSLAFYWMFYIPCNWRKGLDDVSYDKALGSNRNTCDKRDAINRIRRLRKIGIRELPPPFPNGWYSIMESSTLRRGEAISVSCLGENFVVYRTKKKEVHVLDAYCPHMGANMGVGGRVVDDNIECPFHRWSFRGSDGKCVNVPYSSCVPNGSRVRKWISREVHDNIFIWYHSEKDAIPWDLPVITEIENKQYVYHGRNEFYINCHIQEIPENGADLAHFAAIHNASILAGGVDPKASMLANTGSHYWNAIWKPSDSAHKHLAIVTLKHSLEMFSKIHVFEMDVTGEQIGPSYVQLHIKSPTFGRIEVLQTVTPIEPMLQKVVHRFYAPRILGPIMKFVVLGESIMFERDINMWNHKMYRNKPQLVKEDAAIKSFRNWYSQFYSENSKSFTESRSIFDW